MFRQRVTNNAHIASAHLMGTDEYPDLRAHVTFTQRSNGVLVAVQAEGMPHDKVLGFHIHTGVSCTGNAEDPFADALGHYNPHGAAHPYHAGDLPPLFTNNGYAYMTVLTNRFTVREIAGKTVIIHSGADDFTTQPSGNSGMKIACGVIHLGK